LVSWARQNLASYDIVHLHLYRTFQNIQIVPLAKRFGKPYILSAHGSLPIIIQRKLPKRIYDLLFGHRILREAAGCLAVSPVEVEQYRAFGVPPKKVEMILNGLDLDEFDALPASGNFRREFLPSVAPDAPLILYQGRIDKVKNIDLLIKSFHAIQGKFPSAHLAIVGPDEGKRADLEKLVVDLQVKNVSFLGPLYGKQRLAALQDASMMVLPSSYEIFGLALFEAILCGTPVVVSDDCGAGMLIEQADAGYTFRLGDVNDLAEKMSQILSALEKAQEKVQRGKAYIRENLDWNKLVDDLVETYQKVIAVEAKGA
jgi:glycosyltransferase involved in cell wall biosynthesis